MSAVQLRERVREQLAKTAPARPQPAAVRRQPQPAGKLAKHQTATRPALLVERPRISDNQARRQALRARHKDERFQHELREMQQTHDLREVDDDVEAAATLYEWYAPEHTHRPKSARWYVVLATGITVLVGLLLFLGNFIGAITIGLVGGLIYYLAQQKPGTVRYRIMVDGVAMNDTLYHYRDLKSFNVVYEPGEVKTVILRSHRTFAPLLHMEIGDADPVDIRDILLEFLPEDQDLEEPLADIIARRLGF